MPVTRNAAAATAAAAIETPAPAVADQETIKALSARLARLEAEQLKRSGYKDIMVAVENAVRTVDVDSGVKARLIEAIEIMLRRDAGIRLRTLVMDAAREKAAEITTNDVADRVINHMSENSVMVDRMNQTLLSSLRAASPELVDRTLQTAITERVDAMLTGSSGAAMLQNALTHVDGPLLRRFIESPMAVRAVQDATSTWLRNRHFTLSP